MSGEGKREKGEGENHAAFSYPSPFPLPPSLPIIHSLGLVEYLPTWEAMKQFTAERGAQKNIAPRDEIWLVQHPPTYTQGLAGKPEHLLNPTRIPVVKIDRGGQITYHGPGQIVAYLLLDLRRWQINVRELVRLMEQTVIDLLGEYGAAAHRREDAPGVYVNDAKIAALGLKIKHGCCYHGLALNVDMDLTPFANINPCGYAGLRVTQCCELGITAGINELQAELAHNLVRGLQLHRSRLTAAPTILERTSAVGAAASREIAPEKQGNRALRKGRVSVANGIYLVTATTFDRQKLFEDFDTGCAAARCFEDSCLLGDATMLAWMLMPDHAHWVLQLGTDNTLSRVVCALKSASALQVNRALNRNGPVWARAFHDHALRDDESLRDTARYVVANPLRAGLVSKIGDYPFWNAVWLEQSLMGRG
jgi:lipoyl(octanoyl) transferase